MSSKAQSEADHPGAQSRIVSILESVGAVAIAFAAAFCSGIASVRTSPIALATVVVSGFVLLPFVCLACVTVTIGVACCVPVICIGVACASVPVLVRRLRLASALATSRLSGVSDFARENPLLVGGVGLAMLPLTPVILIGGALGAMGYFFFAPVTIPATIALLWRFLPRDEAPAAAEAMGRGPQTASVHSSPRGRYADPHAFVATGIPAAPAAPANTPMWGSSYGNSPKWGGVPKWPAPQPAAAYAYAKHSYAYTAAAAPRQACAAPPTAAPRLGADPAPSTHVSTLDGYQASPSHSSRGSSLDAAAVHVEVHPPHHEVKTIFSLPPHLGEGAASGRAAGQPAPATLSPSRIPVAKAAVARGRAPAFVPAPAPAAATRAARPPTPPRPRVPSEMSSSPMLHPADGTLYYGGITSVPTPPRPTLAVPLMAPGADATTEVDAAFLAAATRALAACKAAEIRGEMLRGSSSVASSA